MRHCLDAGHPPAAHRRSLAQHLGGRWRPGAGQERRGSDLESSRAERDRSCPWRWARVHRSEGSPTVGSPKANAGAQGGPPPSRCSKVAMQARPARCRNRPGFLDPGYGFRPGLLECASACLAPGESCCEAGVGPSRDGETRPA